MTFHPSQHERWFCEEVLPHADSLRGFLRARFPGAGDPDDLIQESYVRILKAHANGPVACPKAFLFVTARNLALNHIRHKRYEAPNALEENDLSRVIDDGADTHGHVEHAESLGTLIMAIQSLPDRCRQIVTLRKIYGLSQKEVARQLGISEHTVETQSMIGLRKCVEFFRRRGLLDRP